MSSEININEIVRSLKGGKLYPLKIGKTMGRYKTKAGIKYYPRHFVRLPTKFIRSFGLKEGDVFYAIPQKLLDNEIVRLLGEGKLYPLKIGKIMESHKTGIKPYPRFFIYLPTKFVKTFGLKEGDIFYAIPQKLPDNEINKHLHDSIHINENHSLGIRSSVKVRLRLYKRIIKGREYWYIQGKLPAGVNVTKLPKERVIEW